MGIVALPCEGSIQIGVDLISDSGESTAFGYGVWSQVLEIARKYGWKPLGTEAPQDSEPEESWNGAYESSDGQRVIAADARSLADALDAAVADPKLRSAVMWRNIKVRWWNRLTMGRKLAAAYAGESSFEEYRDGLQEFAGFCRKGSFIID